ncbi:hypothetical protein Tco_0829761 [Tanacetum coccineum]
MGTKNTSSSGSVLEEPEIQKLQIQAKDFQRKSFEQIKWHLNQPLNSRKTEYIVQQAFANIFGDCLRTFLVSVISTHEELRKTLLNAENSSRRWIPNPPLNREVKEIFRDYTTMTAHTLRKTIHPEHNSIE